MVDINRSRKEAEAEENGRTALRGLGILIMFGTAVLAVGLFPSVLGIAGYFLYAVGRDS